MFKELWCKLFHSKKNKSEFYVESGKKIKLCKCSKCDTVYIVENHY